jgi:hypothetical protein
MARIERIRADFFLVLFRDDPLYPRHPRSIEEGFYDDSKRCLTSFRDGQYSCPLSSNVLSS